MAQAEATMLINLLQSHNRLIQLESPIGLLRR